METPATKKKINIYNHEIDLTPLKIPNQPREDFRKALESIKYRGYEVEQLADGRKIIIAKPGGKSFFGNLKREDFLVWVFNESENLLWLISHKDIFQDLEEKGKKKPQETIKIIDALERVCGGAEPDAVLAELGNPCGEAPELLLKAYKWIWGQEDCNYPNQEGRMMSMKGIIELRNRLHSA